ncbi:MAG: ParB/RepB/Spo0J family partition protein [Hyphomicrobiaceae bacterium]|nr:ParB/RepB/Spo0J family partition protein [Hyphomicrobiaceae bacterium]
MTAPVPKSRLGRGLASLIGEPQPNAIRLPPEGEQRLVATDQLKSSPLNPRKEFREDELAELAESIRIKGLVQPIIARPDPSGAGGYEIVAGERRWRAALKAGVHTVPVIVRDLDDRDVLELAIIENVQRADLNAIEEAGGYRELVDRYGYSQEQLSEIIGKSRSHVANTLRLLKLPASVQALVQMGQLSAGHARALIGREDAERLAERILAEDLNVREVEALVQAGGEATAVGAGRKPREKDADTKAFEKELTDALGLKIEIKRGSGESGNLIIKYGNFDQLDYIRMRLVGMNS